MKAACKINHSLTQHCKNMHVLSYDFLYNLIQKTMHNQEDIRKWARWIAYLFNVATVSVFSELIFQMIYYKT